MSERQSTTDVPLTQRLAANPRPALVWVAIGVVLIGVEAGALVQVLAEIATGLSRALPGDPGLALAQQFDQASAKVPTLLSRETIPNQGYYNGERYVNTFLGLEPAYAWAVRVVLIYAYSFALLGWLWNGYQRYREHYRQANWTPKDDIVDRFSSHRWGQFGFIVVALFLVLAVFAPALGPTTVNQNIMNPYSNDVKYWDAESEEVKEVTVGRANLGSGSQGAGENVGPMTYDDFGRFHPFGTTTNGKDLFTFMATGARVSLAIGLSTMLIAGLIAISLAMLTAYYKGLADLLVVVTSDSVQSLPTLMVLILMMVVFRKTWLAEFYDGAALMVMIFILLYWPFLWRAVRGPALQVAEQEWVDAAKSYDQLPRVIMQKHMAPYIVGYLLVYASMSLGGIIISIAGLSYLGLGINPPTPEWGRIITSGQPYVATASWHISLIPGILITLVVTGFNALGDGIRDAIDPQSEGSESGSEVAAAGGSGA